MELLIFWVQAHVKLPEISPEVAQKMNQILEVLVKRVAFPRWASLEIEPEEKEAEYSQYRQDMVTLYMNLSMNKNYHSQVLQSIYNLLEKLDPSTTPVNQAEVPLLLIFNLIQSIS